MVSTLELYGSNGVSKIGMKFNDVKPIVYLAIGFSLGVIAVNIINNQKRQN